MSQLCHNSSILFKICFTRLVNGDTSLSRTTNIHKQFIHKSTIETEIEKLESGFLETFAGAGIASEVHIQFCTREECQLQETRMDAIRIEYYGINVLHELED